MGGGGRRIQRLLVPRRNMVACFVFLSVLGTFTSQPGPLNALMENRGVNMITLPSLKMDPQGKPLGIPTFLELLLGISLHFPCVFLFGETAGNPYLYGSTHREAFLGCLWVSVLPFRACLWDPYRLIQGSLFRSLFKGITKKGSLNRNDVLKHIFWVACSQKGFLQKKAHTGVCNKIYTQCNRCLQ